jgi:transcriptional regulator with XRE-family HTH domain
MKQNLELLTAIRTKKLRQKDFAKIAGVHPSLLSRVINGYSNLTEVQKVNFAKSLKCKVNEIFED